MNANETENWGDWRWPAAQGVCLCEWLAGARLEVDAAVARVLGSGRYILGPEVDAFGQEFAAYCGAARCIGLANGLDAMHLALRAMDIGPGDEVIVPSDIYIASWLAVSQCRATPVPVEPLPGSLNLDPSRVESALTPRTRVLMPVHLYGQPADLDPLLALARQHGLRVLEDAAQAHGARYKGRRIGAHGDAVAWSFYPGENLGALGDGGAFTTNDAPLAERIKALRNYGSRIKYVNDVQGYNSRLDPIQVAVLRVKLQYLDSWNERRSKIAARYLQAFAPALLQPPQCQPGPTLSGTCSSSSTRSGISYSSNWPHRASAASSITRSRRAFYRPTPRRGLTPMPIRWPTSWQPRC